MGKFDSYFEQPVDDPQGHGWEAVFRDGGFCQNGDCETEAVECVRAHDDDAFPMCAVCARAYRLGYETRDAELETANQ